MLKIMIRFLHVIVLFSVMYPVYAGGIPSAISYQGKLTDESGKPVPNGSYLVEFNIYRTEKDTEPGWQSKPMMVNTAEGLFITLISDIPLDVFEGNTAYLETWINDKALSPRQPIVSVGYAFRAAKADDVANGAIGDRHISTSAAINPTKIAGTAWTSQNDGTGSGMDADKLDGLDAVSFVKPGDVNSVTGQMIQDGSVGSSDLSLPSTLSASSSSGAILKAQNTSTLKGWGMWGLSVADGSDGFSAGMVGSHGASLRNPQEWNSNYKRIGLYGYSAYTGSSAAASGHGVVGWSEQGYGGLFHSTGSYALVSDGTSYLGGNATVAGGLTLSGNQSITAPAGMTIDGPGDLDVVVATNDITIKGGGGAYVRILANGSIEIKSATNMNITAGTSLNLSGMAVTISSSSTTQINGSSMVDVNGGIITLN